MMIIIIIMIQHWFPWMSDWVIELAHPPLMIHLILSWYFYSCRSVTTVVMPHWASSSSYHHSRYSVITASDRICRIVFDCINGHSISPLSSPRSPCVIVRREIECLECQRKTGSNTLIISQFMVLNSNGHRRRRYDHFLSAAGVSTSQTWRYCKVTVQCVDWMMRNE